MKLKLTSALIAALTLTACDTSAAGFRTMSGSQVYALEGGVFEVVPKAGVADSEFWCAAADYARRALGAGWQAPFYVYRGRGQGVAYDRKTTVHFTLAPVDRAEPQGWLSRPNAFHVGDSMTVQQGDRQCNVFRHLRA